MSGSLGAWPLAKKCSRAVLGVCTSFPSDDGGVISPSFLVEVGEGGLLFMLGGVGVGSLVGDDNEYPVLLLALLCSAYIGCCRVLLAGAHPRADPR